MNESSLKYTSLGSKDSKKDRSARFRGYKINDWCIHVQTWTSRLLKNTPFGSKDSKTDRSGSTLERLNSRIRPGDVNRLNWFLPQTSWTSKGLIKLVPRSTSCAAVWFRAEAVRSLATRRCETVPRNPLTSGPDNSVGRRAKTRTCDPTTQTALQPVHKDASLRELASKSFVYIPWDKAWLITDDGFYYTTVKWSSMWEMIEVGSNLTR